MEARRDALPKATVDDNVHTRAMYARNNAKDDAEINAFNDVNVDAQRNVQNVVSVAGLFLVNAVLSFVNIPNSKALKSQKRNSFFMYFMIIITCY